MSLLYLAQQLNILKQNNFEKNYICKEKILPLNSLGFTYYKPIGKCFLYIYIYI